MEILSNLTIPEQTITYTAHQIPIFGVIFNFVFYLSLHIVLGKQYEKYKKIQNPTEEDKEVLRYLKPLYKWWPVIYLVFILIQYAI